MGEKLHSNSKGRFAPAMLAVAGLAFAMPAAWSVVDERDLRTPDTSSAAPGAIEYLPFTPAGADPQLARRVAEVIGEDALRFTPASKPRQSSERTVNFAVRVDDATARSISGGDLSGKVALATPEAISPIAGTRYNLGIARGFQSFAQPSRAVSSASVTAGVREDLRDIAMPDLSTFGSRRLLPPEPQPRCDCRCAPVAGTRSSRPAHRRGRRRPGRLRRNADPLLTAALRRLPTKEYDCSP